MRLGTSFWRALPSFALALALHNPQTAQAASASPYTSGVDASMCMDVSGASTANGAAVQLWSCNGTNAQSWTYINGTLQVLGSKCLDVTDGAKVSTTRLQTWDCIAGDANQQWLRQGNTFVSAGTHLCIDLPSSNPVSGSHLWIYSCNATNAQVWHGGTAQAVSTPYAGGSGYAVPGRVEAENFDLGGTGLAYQTADNINHGGVYRPSEGVSIFAQAGTSNGYKVGWIAPGQWLNYTVDVASAGTYTIAISAASVGGGQAIHFSVDAVNVTGNTTLPNSGSVWGVFETTTSAPFSLAAGQHIVQFAMDSAAGNGMEVDYFDVAQSNSGSTGGGSGGSTGGTAARGATLPFDEIEAEGASTNGVVLAQSRIFGNIAAEASGRSAVRLDSTGQYVEFVTPKAANSIVVRYAIPDASGGGGQSATLGLYINGQRTTLPLTSRYAWTYGDADAQGSGSESPSAGTAHHFYDEVHTMFADIPAGATVRLQRDAQDSAAYYVIDLVDFEAVPAPLSRPANSISIADYGATPNDGSDDSAAIQNAIYAGQSQGKTVWIPAGTFNYPAYNGSSPKIFVSGVNLQGAGMWYSVLSGFAAQFAVSGSNNTFQNFALFGDVTYRDDTKGWQGFDGPAGNNSRMTSVWIEHQTVGWWVGKGGYTGQVTAPLTSNLTISGIRVRNTYADGVNFADATSNSTLTQSHFRNTGDDAVVTWSYAADGSAPCSNNVFSFNTVQTVWRANCYAIYGGASNSLHDSVCADTSNYMGILISTTFDAMPFTGSTTVERNTLTRAGGPHYGQNFGALRIFADQQPITGVQINDISINSPTFSGIHFGGSQQISNVTLNNVAITAYATEGIWVSSEARGSATLSNVAVSGAPNVGLQNDSGGAFTVTRGSGNSGW